MKELIRHNESYNIIGACMEVHKELGCGFLEAVYQEALAIQFEKSGIPFEQEKRLNIFFKGVKLKKYYVADFICYGNIIIETKATSGFNSGDEAQLINYLKATRLKVGLLVNFGQVSLKWKRMVY